MSTGDDLLNVEVDGVPMKAPKGAMIIQVTDPAGAYVPRFCYHDKLSIAANCRMCLVEVEKAPKPLPACATPVAEGMKIFTRSDKAVSAQKATMAFLLINHPLDCPICDQGGECELQDLAMGFGGDVSRYTERKRVVRDKNLGPLIQTDMTRCIHCTRCVRFGQEIAGLPELGTTGRGENTEIGTYVEHAMQSELSGNIIDLCPVGALTSKPYRYSARAWELRQYDSVAPHDCLGSNVHIHARGNVIKRVVPRDNEEINEVWISDRDRFGYEGLNSEDRLLNPRIKQNGQWRDVDWDTALNATAEALRAAAPEKLGALVSPTSTTEEAWLLQAVIRGLGSNNIDHRLRQRDFKLPYAGGQFPGMNTALPAVEAAQSVLVIGGAPRDEQPLLNHRLRKATRRGANVGYITARQLDLNYPATQIVTPAGSLAASLAGVAKALTDAGASADGAATALLASSNVSEEQRAVAASLRDAQNAVVIVGSGAQTSAEYGAICAVAALVARMAGADLNILTDGPNATGCWLAGALPHQGAGAGKVSGAGRNAAEMLAGGLDALVLLGVEPGLDCAGGDGALGGTVIALTNFASPELAQTATIMLPIASFGENEGSYFNIHGTCQSFDAAVKPPGDARPAWKVLRVLANRLALTGFEFETVTDVRAAALSAIGTATPLQAAAVDLPAAIPAAGNGVALNTVVPMYAGDPLVRRAGALQRTGHGGDDNIRAHSATLVGAGITDGQTVTVTAGNVSLTTTIVADDSVAPGTVQIDAGRVATAPLTAAASVGLKAEGGTNA
ncbi:MAG: NADH-quinone oxidoreductase subunit G [Gammaproteobacteria bacterium]|nr:NADH-quinone oxidoreductase subunit G [Gammaproteobacteria bacterium]